jgi:hypothetical protein
MKLAGDLAGIQSSATGAGRDTESFVVDLESEQGDVETAQEDSRLATFETAAKGVCHGLQTTLNDLDAVHSDRTALARDLATFKAHSGAVTSGIPALSVDAATLRRDIASAHYTPWGANRDLAAVASTTESARSTLAAARSFVAETVDTATTLSIRANGYAAAAQGACKNLQSTH